MTEMATDNETTGNFAAIAERIQMRGKGCKVHVGEGANLNDLQVGMHADGCKLVIGSQCRLRGQIYFTGRYGSVVIGDRVTSNGNIWMNLSEDYCTVRIGDDCLFSNTRFRPSDGHGIFDLESGERLNPPGSIILENQVWVAEDVLLIKGTKIGAGSVIGAKSLVNSDIPANSLAAGSPARILRSGICWR